MTSSGILATKFLLEFNHLFNDASQIFDLYSLLSHVITVSDGYAAIILRVKVYCNANRRSDGILSAVSLANASSLIVIYVKVLG